jgi:hypothetical protein
MGQKRIWEEDLGIVICKWQRWRKVWSLCHDCSRCWCDGDELKEVGSLFCWVLLIEELIWVLLDRLEEDMGGT